MSKTISQLANLIQRNLEGGDVAPTARWDIREITRYVEIALADIIRRKAEVDLKKGVSDIDSQFIIAYTSQTVTKDTDRNEYYTTLPESPLALPRDLGVYQVSLMKDQQNVFTPVKNGFMGLLNGSPAACLDGQIGFYLENGKIWYVNGTKVSGKSVLVKMVQLAGDSMVNQGYEAMVIDMVMRMTSKEAAQDDRNDNNNKVR